MENNSSWCFGTCGQRVSAIMNLHPVCDQQVLYEIAFCDPIKDVRLAAVYMLNQMRYFDPILCYEAVVEDEFYLEHLTPPVQHRFFSKTYGGDFPDRRASIIPYIEEQALLKNIILQDSEEAVVVVVAQMLESPEDLEQAYRSTRSSTEGRHFIGAHLRERLEGRSAKHSLRLAKPDVEDWVIPPNRAPSFEVLEQTANRICRLPYGDQATVTEQETQIAVTAMVELEHNELADALKELYQHPDFRHRNILKRYNGIGVSI